MRPDVVRNERRDDKFQVLKRRVAALARFDGEVVRLVDGPYLARAREVRDAKAIVTRLQSDGVLDRLSIERWMNIELVAVDVRTIAAAHRDLRALAERPALAMANEHRRALARFGRIDEAWVRAKRARIERVAKMLGEHEPEHWFCRVVELVRVLRGDEEARKVAEAGARVRARGTERRAEAKERVECLVHSLETGEPPASPELAALAARLEAARGFPGRARRRRILDVLRRAVGWPSAPIDLVPIERLPSHGGTSLRHGHDAYANLIAEAGRAMCAGLPVARDPLVREQAFHVLAWLSLVLPIGDDGIVIDEGVKFDELLELRGLTLGKATALAKIPMRRETRRKIARWVEQGLDVELVAEAAACQHVEALAQVPDARAARAYATWATRLSAHYRARGVKFALPPELFANLPRNEDLAVLAMCLMEHVDHKAAPGDPIAVLDATLGLFEKLPGKARGILTRLRGSAAGRGRTLFPEFAAWIDDDALLDRCLYLGELAGESVLLPRAIREDFEHAARARGERAHLEKLATRSIPQQGRLDALLRHERTLAGSPKGRTRRRLADRVEQLLPLAYRKELDATFREILRDAWRIEIPSLTPAWRDAVRFWLTVDDNRVLLGRLLQAASNGSNVKSAFPGNAPWIAEARTRMNVDAWFAPRRKMLAGGFELSLEEDPLEVLRMGIPFGTCLALDDGCNAASTVINAIDANKRVLYVRNASGRVVARKLLAISKDATLIGYNLYVALKDAEPIRAAVLEMCRTIACEVGIPLASTGVPAQLHEGFWYDDGTVPFDADSDVADYCASLGLAAPPEWYEELGREAHGWRACEAEDVEAAIATLAMDDSPANALLGSWIVERVGLRAAEKRAEHDASMFVALARYLAHEGEYGMIRVLDVAGRLPEKVTNGHVRPLLWRFTPSPKVAVALVDAGLRALKVPPRPVDRGLGWLTVAELPAKLDDVAGALDVLDSIEPVWMHARRAKDERVETAVRRSANVVEAIFARAPDPDVVVAALMSRHRTVTAQRAALRVAARHELPGGERALTRLALLRPELLASADGIAAILRQARVDRVTEAVARRAPRVTERPFEALRDLLVRCEGIERILGEHAIVGSLDGWSPGPWELAWRRRRSDDALANSLFERAARSPRLASRAMELLALLADVRRIGELARLADETRQSRGGESALVTAFFLDSPELCRRAAVALTDQIAAEQRRHVDLLALPVADAAYVDLAWRRIADSEMARQVVLSCNQDGVVDWERLLAFAASVGDEALAVGILDGRILHKGILSSRVVVDVWQLPGARRALASCLARMHRSLYCPHVWAAEREASARGLSVEGLLEHVALALVDDDEHVDALHVATLDQLRSVLVAIVSEAQAKDVAAAYRSCPDVLTIAFFLRALGRQSRVRLAEIREAVNKLELSDAKGKALLAWLGRSVVNPRT